MDLDMDRLKSSPAGTHLTLRVDGVEGKYVRSGFGRFPLWVNVDDGEALTRAQQNRNVASSPANARPLLSLLGHGQERPARAMRAA